MLTPHEFSALMESYTLNFFQKGTELQGVRSKLIDAYCAAYDHCLSPHGVTSMIYNTIENALLYECEEGIHTYRTCSYCGLNPSRGERCAECWRKVLLVMNERTADEEPDEPSEDGC